MTNSKTFEINDVVNLAFGEDVLKTYGDFDVTNPLGKGHLVVTNKRLIFQISGKSKDSQAVSITEWDINEIKGIQSEYGKRRSKGQVTLSFFILLLGLGVIAYSIFYFISKSSFPMIYTSIGVILFITGLIVMFTSNRKMFCINISAREFTNIITLSSSMYKSVVLGKIQISPNKLTNSMIKDLGAVILNAKGK